MGISKFNYKENKGLEENLEIDANTFDSDFEDDDFEDEYEDYEFESNIEDDLDVDVEDEDDIIKHEDKDDFEDYAYKSDDGFDSYGDFFNGSSTESSSFDDFEGDIFSGRLFGDDTFESLDNKQMKKFLSKWFKIFAGLGVCLTVLGVLLNNVLKRK